MDLNKYVKYLVSSILAGMCIGIGGCVYLGTWACVGDELKWVGAILFTIGLFTVFTFGFDLYTGKVGYLVDNKPSYLGYLLVIFVGNFIGCAILGYMMPDSAIALDVQAKMVDTKLVADPDYLRIFFKGVLCGILMFIAADHYKTKKSYLAAFVCVPVFILSGFEHCIADMFYFCCAGAYSLDAAVFIIVVALGNAVGGILIPLSKKYTDDDKAKSAEPQ